MHLCESSQLPMLGPSATGAAMAAMHEPTRLLLGETNAWGPQTPLSNPLPRSFHQAEPPLPPLPHAIVYNRGRVAKFRPTSIRG